MVKADFQAPTGLFVASGVLTYGADDGEALSPLASATSHEGLHMGMSTEAGPESLISSLCIKRKLITSECMTERFMFLPAEMNRIQDILSSSDLCGSIYYKEMFLPREVLEGSPPLPL